MVQISLQTSLPTGALIVKVSAPSGELTGGVDLYPFSRSDDSRERPFGKNFPAAHTRALGHMPDSPDRFL